MLANIEGDPVVEKTARQIYIYKEKNGKHCKPKLDQQALISKGMIRMLYVT